MGLKDDLERYRQVGEDRREDLAEFIKYGDLGRSREDTVRIPIKIVDLPEFQYDRRDMGGVGQGDVQEGDPVGQPQPQPGDEPGEPGDESSEHEYYEMDPEEFAQELDDELGLDLEPKGKEVIEEKEGEFTEISRSGPRSTLDIEYFFREGLKRKLAMDFDENYVMEALRIDGWGPERVFEWARDENIPVSLPWIKNRYEDVGDRDRWSSLAEMNDAVAHSPTRQRVREEGVERLPFRREDERFRHPEIIEEHEKNVVVVNIRDVSGSMRADKRELVERTFTPLDWYLQGKYDHAEFVYIAHDAEAWKVEREDFFGIRSGGGTKISTAYDLAADILEAEYPWRDWNRYVFAAGDSENSTNDTEERVIPLMEAIDANLHAYVETRPDGGGINATHADEIMDHFGESEDVAVVRVTGADDVINAIYDILSTESEED